MRYFGRIAITGALALGALAGCGDEGGEEVVTGAPTAEFMAQAAEASQSDSYRFEMLMSMSGISEMPTIEDVPLMTGESDGSNVHMEMDFQSLMDSMGDGAGMLGDDLSMEMVTTPEALYIKSGIFSMMAGLGGDAMEPFAEMGDSWGKVDLTAFEDLLPADVASNLGGQGADPTAFLDLLENVGEVEELGSETQEGVALTGYAAEVSLGEMLEAQGTAPEDFGAMFGDSPGGDVSEAILEVELPIEVWIDEEGLVRRMVMEVGGAELADAMGSIEDVPESAADEMESFVTKMDMRFDDFGSDVTVEVPEDAVDITTAYEALIDMGSGLGG